jgi:hypothetical protein
MHPKAARKATVAAMVSRYWCFVRTESLLEQPDLDSLVRQGQMLTCFVMNGYLNLLCQRFSKEGCRRLHSTTLATLQLRRQDSGET